jgi:hypothetical protein
MVIIFINKTLIITGFTLAELFNSKFEHLIKDTFKQRVRDFYGNATEEMNSPYFRVSIKKMEMKYGFPKK